MKNQKLTEKELNQIKEFQLSQEQISLSLGQIEIQKRILKEQKSKVLEQYYTLQTNQSKLVKELQEKYGDGNINIETGEFTSSK